MSGTEQVLYLVVAPGVVVAIIWALASIGGPQAKKRYRPGRPYDFTPVWYLANHANDPSHTGGGSGEESTTAEIPAGAATGGASDRW
jgi:hypothetical protein